MLCWLFGHRWKPVRVSEWYAKINEAYVCTRCGKYEED